MSERNRTTPVSQPPSSGSRTLTSADFQALFEACPALLLVLSVELGRAELEIVAVSDAYLAATMTRRDEILGRGLFEVFPDNPDDPTANGVSNLRASLARVLATRQVDKMPTQRYDIRRPASEGGGWEVRHWQPVNSPVLAGDALRFIIHQVDDVTERLAHERTREERGRLSNTLESLVDSCFTLDGNWLIAFVNAAGERQLGRSRADLLGQLFWDCLPGPIALLSRAALEQAMTTAQPVEGLVVNVGDQWFEVSAAPSAEGLTVILRDTTAAHRAEQRLREQEVQLLRAQRLESIGALAGGIAHDLNNVLAPILMAVDLLGHDATASQQKTLGVLQASAQRGADMVRQVLSFARGLEGRRAPFSLEHLCDEVAQILSDTFPRSVATELRIERPLWPVLGDATQLHQVLLNLAVNARDAMPHGGQIRLTARNTSLDEAYVTMHAEARPGPHVMVEVADTGEGIPPGILERIFEPFFTTKPVGEGTGLGLSTCRSIVKSHGGFLTVYSEPRRGSRFRVYLPADLTADQLIDATAQRPTPNGNGELVLVVDDEAAIRTIARQTLEAHGYRVIDAGDGAEAIALYARSLEPIALVITDVAMPIMDGLGLIRALQRINPAVRVIATSGLGNDSSAVQASGSSVRLFLTKPYTAHTLLCAIQEVLSAAPPAAPPGA